MGLCKRHPPPSLGAACGVLLALVRARYLQPLLFQVSARDPWVLGSASILVILLAIFTSWISSQKARHLDPVVVLRAE